MSEDDNKPGLLAGHAQYVKGAVTETIGSLTGSGNWTQGGANDKSSGIQQMKDASKERDAATSADPSSARSSTLAGLEEQAGKLVGCEGMVDEGSKAKQT